jgi:hypothetical protein
MSEDFKILPVLTAVRESVLTATQRHVLIAMAHRASLAGECWAANPTIGADCGLEERAVRTAIKALAAHGVVVDLGVRGRTRCWRLHVGAIPRRVTPTPDLGSGVEDGPRIVDPGTPDRGSGYPDRGSANPGSTIRRSVHDPSMDPSSDPSTDAGARSDPAQAFSEEHPNAFAMPGSDQIITARECQERRCNSHSDVKPALTGEDMRAIRRWAKADHPSLHFALVWDYFGTSDDFEPAQARAKGHYRWSTLCNDRFEERLTLAQRWSERGRVDPLPKATTAGQRAATIQSQLGAIGQAAERVIITVHPPRLLT